MSDQYCKKVDMGKYCCNGTNKMEFVNGVMMCKYGDGKYKKAVFEGFSGAYSYNPMKHSPFIKTVMIAMYIFLPIFIGVLIWYIPRFDSVSPRSLSFVILITILLMITGDISVIYMLSKGVQHRVDRGWFDAWSFAHFFRDMLIVAVAYHFGISPFLSAILSISFAAAFEIFEYTVMRKYWYNFGAETKINQLSDVVLAVIASLFAWFCIVYFGI